MRSPEDFQASGRPDYERTGKNNRDTAQHQPGAAGKLSPIPLKARSKHGHHRHRSFSAKDKDQPDKNLTSGTWYRAKGPRAQRY